MKTTTTTTQQQPDPFDGYAYLTWADELVEKPPRMSSAALAEMQSRIGLYKVETTDDFHWSMQSEHDKDNNDDDEIDEGDDIDEDDEYED